MTIIFAGCIMGTIINNMSKPTLRDQRFKVGLTKKEFAQLRKLAKKNDKYMAEVAREFILQGLAGHCKYRKPRDAGDENDGL